MTRIFFSTRISPITRMLVRVGTLTWRLLNENDTKVEALYSFSPTTGKEAFIVLTYRKSSKSSLLYIIQCLKFNSE